MQEEFFVSDLDIPDSEPRPSRSCTVEVETIPTQLLIGRAQYGELDQNTGIAGRLGVGYEWANGFGIRAQAWSFGDESTPAFPDVEVSAGSVSLDFYKRFYLDSAEFVLGAGPRLAHLEVTRPNYYSSWYLVDTYDYDYGGYYYNEGHYEFDGGGLGVFGEWYQPLVAGGKNELAFTSRARMSLIAGKLKDASYYYVQENDDTIAILEAAIGLEYRRRFSRANNRYWLVRVEPEFQRWDSTWFDSFAASSLGFLGVRIGAGVAW